MKCHNSTEGKKNGNVVYSCSVEFVAYDDVQKRALK